MRSVLALGLFLGLSLGLLISLCGVANAAPAHHTHRHAAVRSHQGASSFAYAPAQSPRRDRSGTPDCNKPEPYFGACQGYAPGEKDRFLSSLWSM